MNMQRRQPVRDLTGLFLILSLVGLFGCTSLPQATRTGIVHEIEIGGSRALAEVTVAVGDEVRWVNHGQLPIRIELVADVRGTLSCERGFSKLFGAMENSAALASNQTASLCFTKTGVVPFHVQRDSALSDANDLVKGTILITGRVARR